MAAGGYLDTGEPVVLLGNSGTGKTHLLIGLGVAACEQGRRVRYTTCAQLVNELVEAADERRLARLVARYGRFDLVCIDELGYVKLDSRGAELLFQVLTEREEKNSIATASNLPFSEWGQIITDPRLVAAVIDRAHVQRPHHRNRHRQLPPPPQPHPPPNPPPRLKRPHPHPHPGLRSRLYGPHSTRFPPPKVGPTQLSTGGANPT